MPPPAGERSSTDGRAERKKLAPGIKPGSSALRRAGLQRQRMQLAAHFALQRLIDDLVLPHSRLAAKGLGNDGRRVMVAVTGEIADRHLGVRNACPDQPLAIARSHRHGASLNPSATCILAAYQITPPRGS